MPQTRPSSELPGSQTTAGLRALLIADELSTLRPWVLALRSQDVWVDCCKCSQLGPSQHDDSEFDILLLFSRGQGVAPLADLRQAHPRAFLALVAPNRKSFCAREWIQAGFDGLFTLCEPLEDATSSAVAAARFARRTRELQRSSRQAGSLTLDHGTRAALLNGRQLNLTAYEFSLLSTLARNLGLVLSRQQLLEQAKGSAEEAFDRSIDVQISRLRAKLGDDPRKPHLLKTVRGQGYVLVPGTL